MYLFDICIVSGDNKVFVCLFVCCYVLWCDMLLLKMFDVIEVCSFN
jgi:hypothetical protein